MGVWVCGATSGIGSEVTDLLLREGVQVYATGPESCDVSNEQQVERFVMEHLPSDLGGFVYSAGINELQWLQDTNEDQLFDLFEVNVFGFLRCIKYLVRRGYGEQLHMSVVVIGSDAAWRPMRTSAVYCASKAALHQAAMCVARETAPHWSVNVVAPGVTADTHMTAYVDETVQNLRGWTPEFAQQYETSQIPMGRRAQPHEVAEVVSHLLLLPYYVTGTVLAVNGGR